MTGNWQADQVRVWVDGRLGGREVQVDALDHGVTVGDGAFETCKVVDGRMFARDRHHARMDRSLAALGLPPLDRDRMQEGLDAVLSAGPLPFGRVRYTVTAGAGPLGSDRIQAVPQTYMVTAVGQERPASACSVALVPWARNERGALAGVKSTSYAENVVSLATAKRMGHAEALLANTAGYLCEGTASNVFVVLDGVVLTPSLETGPLAGVTRALTVEWLREEGLEVVEDALPLSILNDADELWITASIRDIVAVTRLDVAPAATLASGAMVAVTDVGPRVLGDGPGPVGQVAQEVFARRAAGDANP